MHRRRLNDGGGRGRMRSSPSIAPPGRPHPIANDLGYRVGTVGWLGVEEEAIETAAEEGDTSEAVGFPIL